MMAVPPNGAPTKSSKMKKAAPRFAPDCVLSNIHSALTATVRTLPSGASGQSTARGTAIWRSALSAHALESQSTGFMMTSQRAISVFAVTALLTATCGTASGADLGPYRPYTAPPPPPEVSYEAPSIWQGAYI